MKEHVEYEDGLIVVTNKRNLFKQGIMWYYYGILTSILIVNILILAKVW